eukprot:Protomagalhaensia_sp_Gyna_25__217@NODE_10_length_9035_cov_36_916852_g6_i2_p6_GENE_NODE_10_length_9035_cov_36_916852_g6_i2NODE_10_length_9035_cov_36_916852_g6_i2_p6_ORF_typecomplete_len264_score30_20STIMATE/PF12400_8/3_4e32_NODE_10_length_9035_cov_36_916852_g6_i227733564
MDPLLDNASATSLKNKCVLFNDSGWYVQILLGILSFASLLGKRWMERPRRTWLIFCFDAGKQAIGSLFAHSLNLSFAFGQSEFTEGPGDACDYYWLNIMLDTTLGVFIAYITLMAILSTPLVKGRLGVPITRYGYYGNPPEMRLWAFQLLVWLGVIAIMKFIILLFLVVGQNMFEAVAQLVLLPVHYSPNAKLLVVMILTPIVMNTFQYWITDNFIKFNEISYPSGASPHVGNLHEDSQTLLYSPNLYSDKQRFNGHNTIVPV